MADFSYGEALAKCIEELRAMVDSNTVIGTPIHTDGITLIPVSRISFGVLSGGSDFNRNEKPPATGLGLGSGMNITPVAFVVISEGSVRIIPVGIPASNTVDRMIELVPEMVERVKTVFKKDESKKAESTETTIEIEIPADPDMGI